MKKKIVFLAAAILFVFMLCTACSLHTHSFGEWQCSDETYHSRSCSCGKSEKEEHNFEDGKCTVCGYDKSSGTPGGSGNPGGSQGGESNHPEQGDNDQKQPHGVLEFEKNENSYSVIGIGTCKDTDIVIPSTYNNLPVTSIGEGAFYGYDHITSVTIPEGVTSIGEWAFCYCDNITSVTLPSSLKSIGENAFGSDFGLPTKVNYKGDIASWCDIKFYNEFSGPLTWGGLLYIDGKLVTDLRIPDNVKEINDYAFSGCYSLISVTLPKGLTKIGEYAFSGCYRLLEVYDLSDTLSIEKGSDDNGCIGYNAWDIYTDKTTPSKIKESGDYLFYDSDKIYLIGYTGSDTQLTLPEYDGKVYEIHEGAFADCSSLTNVIIPSCVTSIGDAAFGYCSSLTSITIPERVTSIGDAAFEYCSSLTSITIPEGVTSIGSYAFEDCNSLTSIRIPGSVTSIGRSAFAGCYRLVEIYNLSNLNIEKGSSDNGGIGLFALDIYTDKTTPSKIKESGDYLFYEGDKIYLIGYKGSDTQLTLPEYDVKNYEINKFAFYEYDNIKSITIPESVTSIGEFAFGLCYNLKNITFGDNSKLTSIGEWAFEYCIDLTSITIPEGVTSIGEYAFAECFRLVEIYNLSDMNIEKGSEDNGDIGFFALDIYTDKTTPSKIKESGDYLFYEGENIYLIGYTGNDSQLTLPEYDGKNYEINLGAFGYSTRLTSVAIPEGVTSIGEGAFVGCDRLTSIAIPDSVSSIGEYAFGYCCNLKNVTFGDNTKLTSIEEGAFEDCIGLTSITIPSSVKSIGEWAFADCDSLTSITISKGVTNIGEYAFDGCYRLFEIYNLSDLNIEKGSEDNGCIGLYALSIYTDKTTPSKIKESGDYLFYEGDKIYLIEYKGDRGIIYRNNNIIYTKNNMQLMLPEYGGKNYEIYKFTFADFYGLTSITIPSCVSSIGEYAFSGCDNLENVTFGDNSKLTSIGSYAFNGCDNLKKVTFGDNSKLTSIGEYAFNDCNSLENVTFGDNSKLTSIGEYAFAACSGLTSITIPSCVTSIDEYTFGYCRNLKNVTFEDNSKLTSIGEHAFAACSGLTSITIPSCVSSIGEYAFSRCNSLENVTFGDNSKLTSIGEYVFADCYGLTSITIPESVTSIDGRAFYGCSSLERVIFENPNGWKVYDGLDSEEVTDIFGDPETAARILRELNYSFVFKRG